MLLAGRFLVSIPWPGTQDGNYYWQHCFWLDRADWSSDGQMAKDVLDNMSLLYTNQVKFRAQRFYFPNTETVYYQQGFPSYQFGGRSPVENPNILICARWHMFGEDGSYTYHLHRQPVGSDYLEKGEWSPVGFTQQSIRLNTFAGQGFYRTKTGSLLDAWWCSSRPAMWQLRHGTKRRNRHGWL